MFCDELSFSNGRDGLISDIVVFEQRDVFKLGYTFGKPSYAS